MEYLVILAATLVAILGLSLAIIHLGFRAPRIKEQRDPGNWGLAFRTVSIPTVCGRRLFGWLLPVPGATSSVVILHGWGSNAEQMLPMALPFLRVGMNVLLVDARNHGLSDRHGFSSLPRFSEDLERAIDWLKGTCPEATRKIALLGHSVGGGAVLLTASRRNDIDAVISVSTFAHPEWMMRRFLKRFHLPSPLIVLVIRYIEWVIGYRFEEIAPMYTVCRIRCPILLVHGGADRTVPVGDAWAIKQACGKAPIRLLIVPHAGHGSVEEIEAHREALLQCLRDAGFPLDGAAPSMEVYRKRAKAL